MLSGLRGIGAGDGSDFNVAIQSGGNTVFFCTLSQGEVGCQARHDPQVQLQIRNKNIISNLFSRRTVS